MLRAAVCPESTSTEALEGGEDRGTKRTKALPPEKQTRWSQIKLSVKKTQGTGTVSENVFVSVFLCVRRAGLELGRLY